MPRRKNGVTSKCQTTVDSTTDRILTEMADLGIHGTAKAEVMAWILRNWIFEHQQYLRENGIFLRKTGSD